MLRLTTMLAIGLMFAACTKSEAPKPADSATSPSATASPTEIVSPTPTEAPSELAARIVSDLAGYVAAFQGVKTADDAMGISDVLEDMYNGLADSVDQLKKAEPDATADARRLVTRRFEQAQKDIAKAASDLAAKDHKAFEALAPQLNRPLLEKGPN